MRKWVIGLVGCLAILAVPACLTAQEIDLGPVKLDIGGRVQTQFSTTSVDRDQLAGSGESENLQVSAFEMRRVRLAVNLTVDDWITAKIQPDFSGGGTRLKDGWLNFGFTEPFQLRFGQFKKPFSLLELTSSTKFPTIERDVRIRGLARAFRSAMQRRGASTFASVGGDLVLGEEQQMIDALGYHGRDIGAAVHGEAGRVRYSAGAFNSGNSLAGRLEYRLPTRAPFTLGAAASYRERRTGTRATPAVGGTAVEIDAEWGEFRRPGLHVLAEAVVGRNYAPRLDSPGGAGADATLVGAQGVAAYFRPLERGRVEGVEPVARVSFGNPDTGRSDDHGMLLTPGINVYFWGRNRLMLDWDVFVPGGEETMEHAVRLQAQMHF